MQKMTLGAHLPSFPPPDVPAHPPTIPPRSVPGAHPPSQSLQDPFPIPPLVSITSFAACSVAVTATTAACRPRFLCATATRPVVVIGLLLCSSPGGQRHRCTLQEQHSRPLSGSSTCSGSGVKAFAPRFSTVPRCREARYREERCHKGKHLISSCIYRGALRSSLT